MGKAKKSDAKNSYKTEGPLDKRKKSEKAKKEKVQPDLLNLTRQRITADGAFSYMLSGTEDNHATYREQTADYIEQHKADFQLQLGQSDSEFRDFLDGIRSVHTQQGDAAISAFVKKFEVSVTIHQTNISPYVIAPYDQNGTELPVRDHLHLLYISHGRRGGHYDALIRTDDLADQLHFIETNTVENKIK